MWAVSVGLRVANGDDPKDRCLPKEKQQMPMTEDEKKALSNIDFRKELSEKEAQTRWSVAMMSVTVAR